MCLGFQSGMSIAHVGQISEFVSFQRDQAERVLDVERFARNFKRRRISLGEFMRIIWK